MVFSVANQIYNGCKTDNMIRELALQTESVNQSRQNAHTCSICNKQFPSEKALDEHILIHTDAIRQIYRATGFHIPQSTFQKNENPGSASHSSSDKNEMFSERPSADARTLDRYAADDSQGTVANVHTQGHLSSKDHYDLAREENSNGRQQQKVSLANTVAVIENNPPDLSPSVLEDSQLKEKETNVVSDENHDTTIQQMSELVTPKQLTDHNRTHTGDRSYCCSICEESFPQMCNIKHHSHEKHCEDETKPIEKWTSRQSENPLMSICFSNQNIGDSGKSSMNASDNQITSPLAIQKEYNADPDEDTHVDFEGVDPIDEELCAQKEYPSSQFEKSINETGDKKIFNQTENNDVQTYPTEKCDSTTTIKNTNMKIVYAERGELTKQVQAADNLQGEPHKETENFKLACHLCEKQFDNIKQFNQHIQKHSDVYPKKFDSVNSSEIVCCNKQFISPIHLQEHKTHLADEDQCSQSTNPQSDYRNKKKLYFENGKRLYNCSVCNQKFKNTGHLRDHIRTHTGEKPFRCSTCDKSFAQMSNLKSHRRSHEKPSVTESKRPVKRSSYRFILPKLSPGTCDHDNKHSRSPTHLQKHTGLHYGKGDNQPANLQPKCKDRNKKKLRFGSGNRIYTCDVCDKKFKSAGHLKDHIRTHTGERPFRCSICDKSFTQMSNMKKHRLLHVKDNANETKTLEKSTSDCSENSLMSHSFHNYNVNDFVSTVADVSNSRHSPQPAVKSKNDVVSEQQPGFQSSDFGNENPYDKKGQPSDRSEEALDKNGNQQIKCNHAENDLASVTTDEHKISPCHLCKKDFDNKDTFDQNICKHSTQAFNDSDAYKNKSEYINSSKNNVCVQLSKQLIRHTHLQEHKDLNSSQDKYNRSTYPQSNNRIKKKTHFQSDKRYTCSICNRKFKSGHLKDHIRTHTGERPYCCSLCDKSFIQMSNLKTHMRKKHNLNGTINLEKRRKSSLFEKPPMPHTSQCTSKQTRTVEPFNLDCFKQSKLNGSTVHGQSEHPTIIAPDEHVNLADEFDHPVASVQQDHPTESVCQTDKPDNKSLVALHNNIDHRNTDIFNRQSEEKDIHKHPFFIKKPRKLHSCNICGRKGISRLASHMQMHTEKSHPCPVCGKLFKRKGGVRKHMSVHRKSNSIACDICGKQQGDLASLRNHLAYHTGEKRFTCEICGKRFMWPSSFRSHVRLHTEAEEMQCTCDLCNKTFANKDRIRVHMSYVHFSKKTFNCTSCSKTFKTKHHLNNHLTIHTGEKPHECEICEKRFREIAGLRKHLFSHSGKQPFSCKQCNKRFKNADNLRTHMLIHEGKKPHSCSICGKTFRQRGSVKIHIMRVHDKR